MNSPYHTPALINGGEVPALATATESDGVMSPGTINTAELRTPGVAPAAELRSPGYASPGRMELKSGDAIIELQPHAEVYELGGGERIVRGSSRR